MFFLNKEFYQGIGLVKTDQTFRNTLTYLPMGNGQHVRIFIGIIKDHACVLDMDLLNKRTDDELDQ